MERLTVPVEWKAAAADDGGGLTGWASTFGNVDLGGDIVVEGAFAKSVRAINTGNGIPLLADHVPATSHVLGTIHRASETSHGLRIHARFASTQTVQDVRTLLLEGHLSKLSIGYEPVQWLYSELDGKTVRELHEIKLWETSVVVFPMNPQADVTGAKTVARGTTDLLETETLALRLAAAESWGWRAEGRSF